MDKDACRAYRIKGPIVRHPEPEAKDPGFKRERWIKLERYQLHAQARILRLSPLDDECWVLGAFVYARILF